MYDGSSQSVLFAYKFTGKERDAESGLDNFIKRYDSSSLGRFMSPDEPFVDQEPIDPQGWNLYSYVRNNPLNNVDPTGNACVQQKDGSYKNDNSGGQSCADAAESQKVQVKAQRPRPELPPLDFQKIDFLTLWKCNQCDFKIDGLTIVSAVPDQNDIRNLPILGASPFFPGDGIGAELAEILERTALARAGRGLASAEIRTSIGGFSQAAKDFETLKGAEKTIGNVKVKELEGGSKAVLRNFSGDGRPTLEIQHAGGEVTKIRYN